MAVTRYSDPRAFAAAAAPVAARSEASAMVIAGWVDWLTRDAPDAEEPIYLATYSDVAVTAAAFRRRNYAVRIEAIDDAASVAYAQDLASDWRQLQGVVGTLASCEAFASAWRELTGRAHALRFHLRSHLLTQVNAVNVRPAGAIRAANVGDTGWLTAALAAFIVEANLPDDPKRAAELAPKSIERDEVRVWDDGGPVAFARAVAIGEDAARIGPVWTLASARNRGYATALVAALARELLGRGRRAIGLDTDVANPTSNGVYGRVGFRPLYDFYHFDFVDG